ncbi:MAG: hypothetical protein JST29_05585 [Bacteroidetes bacterium]|nr:hypothetical protein [Bacteroidota bacterium]
MILNANKPKPPLPQTRTALAQMYNVPLRVFNNWVSINADLQTLLKPYTDCNFKVLPPKVVNGIIAILGEP